MDTLAIMLAIAVEIILIIWIALLLLRPSEPVLPALLWTASDSNGLPIIAFADRKLAVDYVVGMLTMAGLTTIERSEEFEGAVIRWRLEGQLLASVTPLRYLEGGTR